MWLKWIFSSELFNANNKGVFQEWGGHLSHWRLIPCIKADKVCPHAFLASAASQITLIQSNQYIILGYFGVAYPELQKFPGSFTY